MKMTYLLTTVIILSMISCKKEMNRSEFEAWWPKNAHYYTASRDFETISFKAGFFPFQYFQSKQENLQEINGSIDQKMVAIELRYALKNGENVMYYGIESEDQYLDRLNYFQAGFRSFCKLEYGGVSYSCIDLHIQPTSGITPYTSILLYFSILEKNTSDEAVLIFRDEIFNNGNVKMRINNLDNIPAIKNA